MDKLSGHLQFRPRRETRSFRAKWLLFVSSVMLLNQARQGAPIGFVAPLRTPDVRRTLLLPFRHIFNLVDEPALAFDKVFVRPNWPIGNPAAGQEADNLPRQFVPLSVN